METSGCCNQYRSFFDSSGYHPVLSISGAYLLNESLALFSEFRYKTAGMMNMHVNYFGTLLRAGIAWEL